MEGKWPRLNQKKYDFFENDQESLSHTSTIWENRQHSDFKKKKSGECTTK